jgi:hypothetical protein
MQHSYKYLSDEQQIIEGSTWRFSTTLRDEAGNIISGSSLATCLLTLYDTATGELIESEPGPLPCERINIKNVGRGTISSQGVLVLTLRGETDSLSLPSDTNILDDTKGYELRTCLIEYSWPATPTKADAIEVIFRIRNLVRRPFVAP